MRARSREKVGGPANSQTATTSQPTNHSLRHTGRSLALCIAGPAQQANERRWVEFLTFARSLGNHSFTRNDVLLTDLPVSGLGYKHPGVFVWIIDWVELEDETEEDSGDLFFFSFVCVCVCCVAF